MVAMAVLFCDPWNPQLLQVVQARTFPLVLVNVIRVLFFVKVICKIPSILVLRMDCIIATTRIVVLPQLSRFCLDEEYLKNLTNGFRNRNLKRPFVDELL